MKAIVFAALFVAFGAACASRAAAESYLPLQLGNTWHYVDDLGVVEVQSITRTDVVLGREVFVNSYVTSKGNLGLDQYWMEGPEGDLLLAGFNRKLDGFGVLYDPPLLFLDAPLSLGREWSSTADMISLPDMESIATVRLGQRVDEAGAVTVPEGTFDAFGITTTAFEPTSKIAALAALNLDGTLRTTGSSVSDWYAAGIGDVQYHYDTLMQLTGYELPTPALASTWGRVKQAYRH